MIDYMNCLLIVDRVLLDSRGDRPDYVAASLDAARIASEARAVRRY